MVRRLLKGILYIRSGRRIGLGAFGLIWLMVDTTLKHYFINSNCKITVI